MSDRLDAALIAAHAADDRTALVALYTQAANEAGGDSEAACFYLTQAYVFALETGDPAAGALNARLAVLGREDIQPDLTPQPVATGRFSVAAE